MPGDVGTFSLSLLLLCLPIAHPFPQHHHDGATLSAGARNVSCVVLLAHYCGDAVCMDIDQDVAEVQSMARTYQCSVHVVSNGEACPSSIDDVSCTLRPHNLGRECGAVTHYVISNYDRLPDRLILAALPLGNPDHARRQRLEALLQTVDSEDFDCAVQPRFTMERTSTYLSEEALFQMRFYKGAALQPAPTRPLRAFARAYLGALPTNVRTCFAGVWRTSRARLHARPRSLYERIASECNVGDSPESAHYVERLAGPIFGALSMRQLPPSTDGEPAPTSEATCTSQRPDLQQRLHRLLSTGGDGRR